MTYAGAVPETRRWALTSPAWEDPGAPAGDPARRRRRRRRSGSRPRRRSAWARSSRRRASTARPRLPDVAPASKCLLRKLKLERVKDWLLMEEEFVTNQEQIKPHTERAADDQSKVDELRGSPMSVGNLEEIIDDKCVHPPAS